MRKNETWKPIEGYENYMISTLGRVWSKRIERTVKPRNGRYQKVRLLDGNKAKWFFVHRLVAIAFIPNPQNKETVDHGDGQRYNNTIFNLSWMTQLEQDIHAIENNLHPVGKKTYKKLSQMKAKLHMINQD